MMIELLDYQLIALLLAAWASGCVTVYVIEERRARKEYRNMWDLEEHINEAMKIANEED